MRIFVTGATGFIGSAVVHQLIEAELENSGRPLVITSAIAVLKQGIIGTEKDMGDSNSLGALRIPSEKMALSLASKGVRTSIVRLPPSVHGDDKHGFIPTLINIASTKGISAYINDGTNCYSAVHREDAAQKHFSWFAPFAAIDSPASSDLTRNLLGWEPIKTGLVSSINIK